MSESNWQILGSDELAEHLRSAATYVKSDTPRTIVTEGSEFPEGAVATGRAMLQPGAGAVVPELAAFRVVDEVVRAVHAGDAGVVYGCYGSFRVPRGTDPDEVAHDALMPLLAIALEILDGDVTDVWARKASLLDEGDAWFATIHLGAVILTLEAMATTDQPPPETSELLIEVTGSDQVLRAEPFRQAISVEPFNGPAAKHGWWEDAGERLLRRILEMDERPVRSNAARLQAVWAAVNESATTGQPVLLS